MDYLEAKKHIPQSINKMVMMHIPESLLLEFDLMRLKIGMNRSNLISVLMWGFMKEIKIDKPNYKLNFSGKISTQQ